MKYSYLISVNAEEVFTATYEDSKRYNQLKKTVTLRKVILSRKHSPDLSLKDEVVVFTQNLETEEKDLLQTDKAKILIFKQHEAMLELDKGHEVNVSKGHFKISSH